jgi:sugar O-acyltransferase (sialic acid O-acetyltransferase NeuD family)
MDRKLILMTNLIIVGYSGHGNVVAEIAIQSGYTVKYWDDDSSKINHEYKIEKRDLVVPANTNLFIAIGANKIREIISLQYSQESFISLIHPQSSISNNAEIGIGTVVMSGVVVNYGVHVGDHCILNSGAIIDHDCTLENYVHVSPNATLCGQVSIGTGTWIGAGATIIQGINIGKNVTIGAGAVIINDVPDNATVVGNPGKVIKYS